MFQNSKLATEPSDIVQCNTKTVQRSKIHRSTLNGDQLTVAATVCLKPYYTLCKVQGAFMHTVQGDVTMNDCANDCSCSNIC